VIRVNEGAMSAAVQFAEIDREGRRVRLEYAWVGDTRAQGDRAPLMVFLHEGLGSVAMWKDFPARLCQALGWRGLVYSRPGYGASTPRPSSQAWTPDFMHRQALEVLPAFLAAVGVDVAVDPPWLFGHSDGGSIALLHAAHFSTQVSGLVVVAPHIFVEALSLRSIAQAREAYQKTDLRQRLARYHDDPDSAFWGWNDVWLHPDFQSWNIEGELASIRAPLLAVQGLDDEYGTLAQIHGIARLVAHTELLEMPDCGHSPHKDQPDRLIQGVQAFVERHCPTN
jgi:pimeloyl-ACP methyl ester carboxylesterase